MVFFGTEKRIIGKKLKLKNVPGPGSYAQYSKSSNIRTMPAFSMGTATRGFDNKRGPIKASRPGPGEYNADANYSIGGNNKKGITMAYKMENHSYMSSAVRRSGSMAPGPGTYNTHRR